MACGQCGHDANHAGGRCRTYTYPEGWCNCTEYVPNTEPQAAPYAVDHGRTMAQKLFIDTRNYRDKAVKDAEAKKRKVGKW